MTHTRISLPTQLITAAKSKLGKSVVISILALSSATAFAWDGEASVHALGCNPLNNACTFKVSDQVAQAGGLPFDPAVYLKAISPSKDGKGVVVDFCLLRSAITVAPQYRYKVLEIMYVPQQIQDKNGYLNASEFNDLETKFWQMVP